MDKDRGFKMTTGLSITALTIVSMFIVQPGFASGDGEPAEAQFQTTGTIVLKQFLRPDDFMLLKDVTPLQVVGGHVAMKVPCNRNEETPLQILAGSASESGSALVAVDLEFIGDISKPGRDCVYHADLDVEKIKGDLLAETGKEVNITDIALGNSSKRKKVWFGFDNSNTVTVNLLTAQGEGDDHHEDE